MKPILPICTLTGLLAANTAQAVVINEVDYDQPGADTAEFIELYNDSAFSVALDSYSIDLVNGSSNSVYRSIDLSGFSIGANGYFVVCNSGSQVANCNYAFTSSTGWIQNGAPDAIALLENGNTVDALSYEGSVPSATEGTGSTLADSSTVTESLSRIPNGTDTNNNQADFQIGCITPGSANIIGSGDCSLQPVSAVPIPASFWLFASGLIGLAGMQHKRIA